MNKRDEKFWHWFSTQYSKLPEGKSFPLDDEDLYDLWCSMWQTAYHVGMQRGYMQGRHRPPAPLYPKRQPMPYYTMEELFTGCKTGREFGLRIEKWHGIGEDWL